MLLLHLERDLLFEFFLLFLVFQMLAQPEQLFLRRERFLWLNVDDEILSALYDSRFVLHEGLVLLIMALLNLLNFLLHDGEIFQFHLFEFFLLGLQS